MDIIRRDLHQFRFISFILCILWVLLGILLFIDPFNGSDALLIIAGAAFLVSGAWHIVMYFRTYAFFRGTSFILLEGILNLLTGLIFLTARDALLWVIPYYMGFWMIFNGIVQIPEAFDLKKTGFHLWWTNLVYGGLLIIGGYILFISPENGILNLMTGFGIAMVVSGINLLSVLILINDFANSITDRIEKVH